NGRPHLAADAIRELMGSVPNTVFEHLLEAISAGQTAAVIEQVNTLLNAGNSPSAIARQFVRYLRNTLMARIGGENSDLLQISADERARAGRSAMLFSEEDLTRFLQVMLRTFDDLNYRQEQRFHLELGLVKLVHLQRLLPVEEILSQLPSGSSGSAQGGGVGTAGRSVAASPARPAAAPATRPAVPPRPSPFESDRERKSFIESSAAASPSTGAGPGGSQPPPPAGRALSSAEGIARTAAEGGAPAAAGLTEPEQPGESSMGMAASAGTTTLESIRDAICAALDSEGHNTAAAQLLTGNWTQQGNAIAVELPMRKTMLALTINADAEAICRKAMRAIGATQKISFVPGENGAAGAAAPARSAVPVAGSAQSAALENPLVRRTQELFKADIRSVLDLRENTSGKDAQ
ncbi:MAG TPA: hypothetical protein VKT75_10830, partial [Acidobacteriaceae bacterium]|nr:hypothetical protein [Acidobacteriaceae bacterium]